MVRIIAGNTSNVTYGYGGLLPQEHSSSSGVYACVCIGGSLLD